MSIHRLHYSETSFSYTAFYVAGPIARSGGFREGLSRLHPPPTPLGDGLTPSLTVMFYCKIWFSKYSK